MSLKKTSLFLTVSYKYQVTNKSCFLLNSYLQLSYGAATFHLWTVKLQLNIESYTIINKVRTSNLKVSKYC